MGVMDVLPPPAGKKTPKQHITLTRGRGEFKLTLLLVERAARDEK